MAEYYENWHLTDKDMSEKAKNILSYNQENPVDYTERFEKELEEKQELEAKAREDNTVCPRCGGKLVVRNGRYGKFNGCTNYPKCRYARQIENNL